MSDEAKLAFIQTFIYFLDRIILTIPIKEIYFTNDIIYHVDLLK